MSYLFGRTAPAEKTIERWPGYPVLMAIMPGVLQNNKEHFRPEDWLFLKAFLYKDREKHTCLLRQAQALCPENGHIFCCLIDPDMKALESYADLLPALISTGMTRPFAIASTG